MEQQIATIEIIEQLRAELHSSREQIALLSELLTNRDKLIAALQQQLKDFNRRLYGKKSEKLDPNQLLFTDIFEQAKNENSGVIKPDDAQPVAAERGIAVTGHTRRKNMRPPVVSPDLARVEVVKDIPEEEKVCACCHEPMSRIGEDCTERLGYKPVDLYVLKTVRPKYACKNATCAQGSIKQAAAPESPLGRCEAEPSMLAHIITEKFEYHMPLYRQEQRFSQRGIGLARTTMSGWLFKCGRVLRPLYDLMIERVLKSFYVHNDDTPVDMLEPGTGKTRTARLWVTIGDLEHRYIVYNFTKGRGRDGPEEFFAEYRGYLVADGYGGYRRMFETNLVKHAGCWVHARRYFKEAQDTDGRKATQVLVLIAELYKIEDRYTQSSAEERLAGRQENSLPVLAKIKATILEQRKTALPRSKLGEAIGYMLGQWESLLQYTTDGRLPIDNNPAENALRPTALGRKNWLFVGSETGGLTAAILMSFCGTCHMLKINTGEYLTDVLEKINNWPQKRLEELLPDQWLKNRAKLGEV